MKKKFYILIITIISLITISTAFIPMHNDNAEKKYRSETDRMIQTHPEAGYIEAIGN